jgi:aspartyl protease family protein
MGDTSYLIYATIMLVILLSSFVVHSRGKGGEVWRAARLWAVIIGALVIGVAFWPDIKSRVVGMFDPTGGQLRDGKIIFRKSSDGHFYARATINNVPVEFVVDTGATDLVLTKADAKRIGVDLTQLNFNRAVSTANGITRSADVTLKTVILGGKTFRNVSASINDGELDIGLLGMQFLSRFGSLKMTADQLELIP